MPIVCTCPRCAKPVTVPDGPVADAAVRCPLCQQEYPLGEALATLPPALIPVEPSVGPSAVAGPETSPRSTLISEPFHVGEPGRISGPAPKIEPSAEEAPAVEEAEEAEEAAAMPRIDVGRAPEPRGAAEAEVSEGAARTVQPRERKKRKEKSALRMILEPIIGGFLGLGLGYYLLNLIGGPRFDFMEFYLPGVPHTYKHRANFQPEPPGQAAPQPAAPDKQPAAAAPKGPGKPAPGPKVQDEPLAAKVEQQPGPGDVPPAKRGVGRKPLPPGYVGPRHAPAFTANDLGAALKTAHEALRGKDATGEMTAEAYQEFCRLGRVLAFTDAGPQLADRREAVRTMLEALAAEPEAVDEIGRRAGSLLDQQSPAEEGILLAGTVGPVVSQGGLHGAAVQLAAFPKTVSVLSDKPLPMAADDRVVLLGGILVNPAENLVGFTGSQPLVVWLGTAVVAPK